MEPLPTVPAPDPAGPKSPTDWSQVSGPGDAPRSSFGIGVILGRTFRTWWRELPAFAVLGIAGSVATAWGVYRLYGEMGPLLANLAPDPSTSPFEALGDFYGKLFSRLGAIWFASFVLAAIQAGAITHGAAQRLRGAKAGLGQMLGVGLQRSFAMFGLMVVAMVALVATSCTLVVPVMLLCAWTASAAAVVVEGAGPLHALGRSWALTRGHRWKILAATAICYLAVFLVVAVLRMTFVGGVVGSWQGPGAVPPEGALEAAALPLAILQLVSGIFTTIGSVLCAVIHHGLCLVKEGGDPAHLAQVFE